MPRGNRLLFTALGFIAALTVLIGVWTWPTPPKLTSYGEANPRSSQYRPGGENCQPSKLATIRNGRDRSRKADTCAQEAEEYRQNTNDLVQQTRAADAAQAQADISSQQLWTGWLQTLGGFLTLAAAAGAAIYARDAAIESRRSADAAWKIGKLQTEPHFMCTLQNLPACDRKENIDIAVEVKNFGNTRGRVTAASCSVMLVIDCAPKIRGLIDLALVDPDLPTDVGSSEAIVLKFIGEWDIDFKSEFAQRHPPPHGLHPRDYPAFHTTYDARLKLEMSIRYTTVLGDTYIIELISIPDARVRFDMHKSPHHDGGQEVYKALSHVGLYGNKRVLSTQRLITSAG